MKGVLVEISEEVLHQTDQEYCVLVDQFFSQNVHFGCGRFHLTTFNTFADNVYFTWTDRTEFVLRHPAEVCSYLTN